MNDKAITESAVELLVVSHSPNDTEMYVNTLRNVGLAVHATRADTGEQLEDALGERELDVVLCDWDANNNNDLSSILDIYTKTEKDVPLIVLHDHLEPADLVRAMHNGARDFVRKDDQKHLQLVAVREISALRTRRELTTAKQLVHEAEERCNSLIDSSRDAIAYVHEGMHVLVNPAYLEMFGFVDTDEIEGLPLLELVVTDEHKKFKAFLRSLNTDEENRQLEVTCQSNDGTNFNALLEFSKASIDGEPCTQIVIRNQANQKELEQKIQLLYSKDTQTGVFNRQYFLEQLEETLQSSTENEEVHALLYITLDNFVELRDTAGLSTSDTVLKEVAQMIERLVDPGDLLARFGDHTFAVLTKNEAIFGTDGLAKNLCSTIDDHEFSSSGHLINCTCSIGVAYREKDQILSAQDLVNRGYSACKLAREEGGGQAVLYQLDASQNDADHEGGVSSITKLISNALEQDRFRLVYQPIVSLQGDSRENYAVLLRMLDEHDKEILPKDFLEQAIQDGLMPDIDRWVIKNALRELADQRNEGRKTNFFINLSAESLKDETLLIWICDCLREFQCKASWVCFQLKDEDIRRHINTVKPLLEGLIKIKCLLAIDRIGVLPKPESLLKHLKFDYAKLDNSFLHELATNQEKQDNLSSINELIHSYGVKSVATAVEDANSLAILWTVGIDYIQGYFLQEPSETIAYDFHNM